MSALKLRNIGPKSAAWLRQVGLRSAEDLAAVGAVGAFVKVRRAGCGRGSTSASRASVSACAAWPCGRCTSRT